MPLALYLLAAAVGTVTGLCPGRDADPAEAENLTLAHREEPHSCVSR